MSDLLQKGEGIVNYVYSEVLETYPFLSSEEERSYIKRAQEFINNSEPEKNLESIDKLLDLLSNPHADIWPVKEKKYQKLPRSPELKIEDGILYIKVPAWSKRVKNLAEDLIKFCRENEEKYKSIIIDVRDNSGGSSFIAHEFAGIFFKDDVNIGRFIKRVKGDGLDEKEFIMPANKVVYIDKSLVILISNKCFSSSELFLAPFKATKRATLIGEKTAGGSGNPVNIEIEVKDNKYIVRIPTWRFFLEGEDMSIEETAIEPDVYYNKKDILHFAKQYLFNKL